MGEECSFWWGSANQNFCTDELTTLYTASYFSVTPLDLISRHQLSFLLYWYWVFIFWQKSKRVQFL